MDLDALLILLQPWLRPFLAFAFLRLYVIFTGLYYCAYCTASMTKLHLNMAKTC